MTVCTNDLALGYLVEYGLPVAVSDALVGSQNVTLSWAASLGRVESSVATGSGAVW